METPQRPSCRVIIAGAGLVGLTAAHMLAKAGIDFVVLEKHDTILPTVGSLMTFWPQTFRIFEQLGLNDVIAPLAECLDTNIVMSANDAVQYDVSNFPALVEKNHGWGFRVTLRTRFIETLYNSLPPDARSGILLGRHVERVEMDDSGVQVTCRDGTVEEGTILIGADGVRSSTREAMEALCQRKSPEDLAERLKRPYLSTYRVLVGQVDELPGVPRNIKCDGVGYGVTTQLMYGKEVSCFAIYEKLDGEPTSEHHRYTDEDKAGMLERWGHLMVVPGYSVRDVQARCRGKMGMYDCEEGVVERWHHGRIVLVGDAVRKLDPHAGMGYNEGVADLVVLVNGLRRVLTAAEHSHQSRAPSTAVIEALLADYAAERMRQTTAAVELSMMFARMAGWLSWKDMVMAKYVQRYLPLEQLSLTYVVGPMISAAHVLDWLEEPRLPAGAVPWKNHGQDMSRSVRKDDKEVGTSSAGVSVFPKWVVVVGATVAAAATQAVGPRFHWRW